MMLLDAPFDGYVNRCDDNDHQIDREDNGCAFTIGCSGTGQTGVVTVPAYLSATGFLYDGITSYRTFFPAFILILVPVGFTF
ncbi:hypothetical protein M0804_005342 [Polistes exclamans]|nr:hypothetical protein M0804_005342 [Polistes exclamans]